MRKWWLELHWGRDGNVYSRIQFVGYESEAWQEAMKLACFYFTEQSRITSRILVVAR